LNEEKQECAGPTQDRNAIEGHLSRISDCQSLFGVRTATLFPKWNTSKRRETGDNWHELRYARSSVLIP
jgi:hypothetical protein